MILLLALSIVLNSNNLLTAPAGVKGDFKIASTPPRVEITLFSGLPDTGSGTLWSSWGNGLVASNGKYYAAIGNHLGFDGDSWVYEYDPSTAILRKIIDVAQVIGQKPGQYGHGKIHAPIVEYQGALYFATYWGKENQVAEGQKTGYRGSLLFRYDLKNQKLENLGAIAPGSGFAASALDSSRGLLYFYAQHPGKDADLLAYDLKKRSVKFLGGSQYIGGFRAFMLAADGKLYFSDQKGRLSFYDPGKNLISQTNVVLPGEENTLRAGSRAASKGLIYGMTRKGRLFEFNPSEPTIKDVGPNFLNGDYTAVMLLSPDEKYLYYAPGSHGSATKYGTPLIQYKIGDGTRKVIAFLRPSIAGKAGYNIAGNYNLQIDPKGETLYAVFNGARIDEGKDPKNFGLPVFVKIEIPAAERK